MQLTTKTSIVFALFFIFLLGNTKANSNSSSAHRLTTIAVGVENFAGKWTLEKIVDKDKKVVTTFPINKLDIEFSLSGKCKMTFSTAQGNGDYADLNWSAKDVFGVQHVWISKDILGDAKLAGITVPHPFSQFTGPLFSPATLNGAVVYDHLEWLVTYNGQQYTVCLKKAA
ncbi:hypothetical protein [Solitalea lacus]|uniref:hypothetical protein n=1 Tax=Solitalea lacus TaxID=2911172 RepID=UPI001EDC7E4C|nr:hypothetical protein [Solitalea lacus]UKJ06038.1 hypothetical protein L2B55_10815 [Solitalea lacus]